MVTKLGLTVLLAVMSGGVLAGWENAGSSDAATLYVDRATIRKSGTMVKMWHLVDYKKLQTNDSALPFWSVKSQGEFDCKAEQYRTLYFTEHTEKMGGGTVGFSYVKDNKTQNWAPVPPGSLVELIWKVACGKD